jgi:hypothetical protein
MPALQFSTCSGELEITRTGDGDGLLSMHCAAWDATDVRGLWLPAVQRGQDRIIPGAGGMLAKRRRRNLTAHSLPFVVTGWATPEGAVPADCSDEGVVAQLVANIRTLKTAILDPTGVGDGTRAAQLTLPTAEVLTANIHVLGLTRVGNSKHTMAFTLDISIPTPGEFQ